MSDLIDRAAVLGRAAVTYLVVAAVAVTTAADELAELAPDGSEPVVAWLIRAAAALSAAVAIVRRVTPVPVPNRGLLGGGVPDR